MILVVGATGLVGKRVALRLREEGEAVRALVRGGAARAEARELAGAGAEIVDGDLTRPDTLRAACRGIPTVVSTVTSMPSGRDDGLRRVDHDGALALIAAAEAAGVQRFVYTSYSGNLRAPSPLETAKRACEDRLLASRMEAVLLRPSFFMEIWLSPHAGFDAANGRARIYGSGEAPVSYISLIDVAEFAAAAAVRPAAGGVNRREGENVTLEMGGPEPLSQLAVVKIFEETLRKKIALEPVPLEALRQQHAAATDPVQKTFAALGLGYAQGDAIPDAVATARHYGVQLRSVRNHAAPFKSL